MTNLVYNTRANVNMPVTAVRLRKNALSADIVTRLFLLLLWSASCLRNVQKRSKPNVKPDSNLDGSGDYLVQRIVSMHVADSCSHRFLVLHDDFCVKPHCRT